MAQGIKEAQTPWADGSDLTDTNCLANSSCLCELWSVKKQFPSFLSATCRGLLSDMSASTLKGRQDTWGVRLFSRSGFPSLSAGTSSLRSTGWGMLSCLFDRDRYLIPNPRIHYFFFLPRNANMQRPCATLTVSWSKIKKVEAGGNKESLGGSRYFPPMMRPDHGEDFWLDRIPAPPPACTPAAFCSNYAGTKVFRERRNILTRKPLPEAETEVWYFVKEKIF